MTEWPSPDPDFSLSHAGLLFQARMWRGYAMDWDLPVEHLRRRWVELILRVDRAHCLRLAHRNLAIARALRGGA